MRTKYREIPGARRIRREYKQAQGGLGRHCGSFVCTRPLRPWPVVKSREDLTARLFKITARRLLRAVQHAERKVAILGQLRPARKARTTLASTRYELWRWYKSRGWSWARFV